MELHTFRKFKEEVTLMRQADGTDRHIRRPQLRSDLIGGEESMESFWALMSVIIDLVIEHVAHQVLTGTPFSPESETEVFLAKIAAKPRFPNVFFRSNQHRYHVIFRTQRPSGFGKRWSSPGRTVGLRHQHCVQELQRCLGCGSDIFLCESYCR